MYPSFVLLFKAKVCWNIHWEGLQMKEHSGWTSASQNAMGQCFDTRVSLTVALHSCKSFNVKLLSLPQLSWTVCEQHHIAKTVKFARTLCLVPFSNMGACCLTFLDSQIRAAPEFSLVYGNLDCGKKLILIAGHRSLFFVFVSFYRYLWAHLDHHSCSLPTRIQVVILFINCLCTQAEKFWSFKILG